MELPGVKIKEFIDRVGIKSQKELAQRLGVSAQTISNWATGEKFPTHETEAKMYEMGITTEELFGKAYPSSARNTGYMDAIVAELMKRLVANIGKI